MIRLSRSHVVLLIGAGVAQIGLVVALLLWPQAGPSYPALAAPEPLLQLQSERFPPAPGALETPGFRLVVVDYGDQRPEFADADLVALRHRNVNAVLCTFAGATFDEAAAATLQPWLERLADHHVYAALRIPLAVDVSERSSAHAAAGRLARLLPAAANLLLVVPTLAADQPTALTVDLCRSMREANPSVWFATEFDLASASGDLGLRSGWAWFGRRTRNAPPLLVPLDLTGADADRARVRVVRALSKFAFDAPDHPLLLTVPVAPADGSAEFLADLASLVRRDAVGFAVPGDVLPPPDDEAFAANAARLLGMTGQGRAGPRPELSHERIAAWTGHAASPLQARVAVPILVPFTGAELELSVVGGAGATTVSLDEREVAVLPATLGARDHVVRLTDVSPGIAMLRLRSPKSAPAQLLGARIRMPGPREFRRYVQNVDDATATLRLRIRATDDNGAPRAGATVAAQRGAARATGTTDADGVADLTITRVPPLPSYGPVYVELLAETGKVSVERLP